MAWKFERTESQFPQIPEGKYRCIITNAEMTVSRNSGNDMMKLELAINGYDQKLWNYIVFLDDRPEITNRMLTQFFDAFQIEEGNFDVRSYIGKAGGVKIKHETYNGEDRARVQYFLSRKQTDELPAWKGGDPLFTDVSDNTEFEELPF